MLIKVSCTIAAFVLSTFAIAASAQSRNSRFENFKREMMPQVGKKITVVGVLKSAKLGWLVAFREWGVYIYAIKDDDIPKMNGLNRFNDHTVQVIGTLRYFPEPPHSQSDLAEAVPPEHFYLDVAEATVAADDRTRRVKGQTLISTSLPATRVKFDKAFRYAGSQQFILYDRAQVEQHFFVDADKQQRLKRMYMVQFESYLPNISGAYNYPVTKTLNLAGQSYIVDAEIVPNVPGAIKQDAQSDVARAASFLEGKGYRIGEGIVFQRFVRLVDEAKRSEFILLYVEDLSGAGIDTVEKEKAMQTFSGRALKGFKILK
jgi:hypothetical protein